jgi:hypothetical protein
MKYIKKFNEELKSSTLLSASKQLRDMGNKSSINRAEKLKEWSENASEREIYSENLISWKENVKKYSKYGSFRLKMTSKLNGQSRKEAGYKEPPVYMEDFYLGLSFDRSMFLDNLSEEAYAENDNDFDGDVYDNYTAKIFLSAELIPKNKESLDKCLKNFPKKSSGNDIFWGGWVSGLWIIIDIKVINGNRFEISNLSVTEYDEYDTGGVSLTTSSAQKLKNLLVSLFEDKSLNYPSTEGDSSQYDTLYKTILIEAGMSSDYGLTLDDIAEYIKSFPKHKLIN